MVDIKPLVIPDTPSPQQSRSLGSAFSTTSTNRGISPGAASYRSESPLPITSSGFQSATLPTAVTPAPLLMSAPANVNNASSYAIGNVNNATESRIAVEYNVIEGDKDVSLCIRTFSKTMLDNISLSPGKPDLLEVSFMTVIPGKDFSDFELHNLDGGGLIDPTTYGIFNMDELVRDMAVKTDTIQIQLPVQVDEDTTKWVLAVNKTYGQLYISIPRVAANNVLKRKFQMF